MSKKRMIFMCYYKKIKIIILSILLISIALNLSIRIHAEEIIDERFLEFLLMEAEVPVYRLGKQYQDDCCLISPDGLGYVVKQDWISNDEDIEIYLTMEIFDSEEIAIRGMKSYMITVEPWVWGSVYGGILGNHSWRSVNDNHAVIFSCGNIGIRMRTNKSYKGESSLRDNQKVITDLTKIQIEKIDQNLAPQIIDNREFLRKTRLSPAEYDRYMAEAVNVNLYGYRLITNKDSLWLLKDEGVRMGIRREWQNNQGRVIGVDICKLESNIMVEDTASERRKMWIDIHERPELSIVIVHDNAVIHRYYLNHEYSVVSRESPQYFPPPPILPPSSSLYPIYNDRLGLAILSYNNPYYNPGSFSRRFPTTPYNNMSLRYPYNANLYKPNLPSYERNSSMPFHITAGYDYPIYYPERYAFPINPKEPYGGYIFPYNNNSPLYSYASPYPHSPLPSGIFNLLASSNLNTARKGIELMYTYWPPF